MAYFINLFSPETYQAFSLSARDVTGFREKQRDVYKRQGYMVPYGKQNFAIFIVKGKLYIECIHFFFCPKLTHIIF